MARITEAIDASSRRLEPMLRFFWLAAMVGVASSSCALTRQVKFPSGLPPLAKYQLTGVSFKPPVNGALTSHRIALEQMTAHVRDRMALTAAAQGPGVEIEGAVVEQLLPNGWGAANVGTQAAGSAVALGLVAAALPGVGLIVLGATSVAALSFSLAGPIHTIEGTVELKARIRRADGVEVAQSTVSAPYRDVGNALTSTSIAAVGLGEALARAEELLATEIEAALRRLPPSPAPVAATR